MNKQKVEISWKGRSVGMVTLGCSRNTVDSEKVLSEISERGARICPVERAQTVLVNTCAFTKEAKDESIAVILGLIDEKKKGRIKEIVVHGCLPQRYPEELKDHLKEVDAFVGVAGFKETFAGAARSARLTPRHYAYIKISEGCANICSYCAIPSIKGPLQSRSEASILEEARALESQGARELILIGQDITLYGRDRSGGLTLTGLLKKILKTTRVPWIRLLYLHPKRVTEDLLDLMASEDRIARYVDMPLQHVNDRILKLMNRGITRTEVESSVARVRRLLPGAALRTTFIVGFPSETDKEFKELCGSVKEARFDKLGAFKYSREEGTPAYSIKPQISEKLKERRYDILMSLQKDISCSIMEKRRGETVSAIVDEEKPVSDGVYVCRSVWDAPEVDGLMYVSSSKKHKAGDIIRARITDTYEYDLLGEELA